jgi:hypothetical protein
MPYKDPERRRTNARLRQRKRRGTLSVRARLDQLIERMARLILEADEGDRLYAWRCITAAFDAAYPSEGFEDETRQVHFPAKDQS